MNESAASRVMLIRAIEQDDPEGSVLSQSQRLEATRVAAADHPVSTRSSDDLDVPLSASEEAFVAKRAEQLVQSLSLTHPEVTRNLHQVGWRPWITTLLLLLSLALGLATNALGPEKRINIVAFPIMGMLLWNLAVYVLLLINSLRHARRHHANTHLTNPLAQFVSKLASAGGLATADTATLSSEPLRKSLLKFTRDWLQQCAPLHHARATRLLHLCAALLVVGTVGGMYWRGLGFEYLAGWESTFLDEHAVEKLLRIVLGPASFMTGINLPSATELAAMRWPASSGTNAGPWIQLYAATAALFIVLPRLILATLSFRTEKKLQTQFPLPHASDPYFRRVLSVRQGSGSHVAVLPCGFQLERRETLHGLLNELLGLNITVRFHDTIPYGQEEEHVSQVAQADAADYLVVLFNLAATPEEETHGRFIDDLTRALTGNHSTTQLLLILEESGYRSRLTNQPGWEERIAERRKAWQRLAAGHNSEIAPLDLLHPDLGTWAANHRQRLLGNKENGT